MARQYLVLIVLACAFAGASTLAVLLIQVVSSRMRARYVQSQAGLGSAFVQLMRNGIPFLNPLADVMLGIQFVHAFCALMTNVLRENVAGISSRSICTLCMAVCGACVVAGSVVGSPIGGTLLACTSMVALYAWMSTLSQKRIDQMREDLPNALNSMGACFHAGFTLLQTFDQLVNEIDGPLGARFARARDALRTGATAQQALDELQGNGAFRELAFVSVALRVQHASGGSMHHVLAATADALSGELELKRSIRVQTAQARLSSKVVMGVTVGLVAVLSLMTKGFLDPFFQSPLGIAMLVCAAGMQLAGLMMVRRLLHVEAD